MDERENAAVVSIDRTQRDAATEDFPGAGARDQRFGAGPRGLRVAANPLRPCRRGRLLHGRPAVRRPR
ncbi:hypothetical protein ACWDKQ_09360 [Saccharopolyspora sp. NPDC000995]